MSALLLVIDRYTERSAPTHSLCRYKVGFAATGKAISSYRDRLEGVCITNVVSACGSLLWRTFFADRGVGTYNISLNDNTARRLVEEKRPDVVIFDQFVRFVHM